MPGGRQSMSHMPVLLVSTATALAARWYQSVDESHHERASIDTAVGDASLGFVHFAGFWSHFEVEDHRSLWPLPPSMGMRELLDFVDERGATASSPLAGDVFLLGSPAA